jgi:hypothetical protein
MPPYLGAGVPAVSGGNQAAAGPQGELGHQQEESIPADPRLLGRLRWGLEGEVVGVQPPDESLLPSQVCVAWVAEVTVTQLQGVYPAVFPYPLSCIRLST